MADFLFATWDGGGNVPPAIGIAVELTGRGHGVRFLGHERQRHEIEGAGLAFSAYPTAKGFDATGANSVPRVLSLFSDRAMGRDVVAEAAAAPTDLVVVDAMLLGPMRACADARLPYVSLEHLFDGYLRRNWLGGPTALGARLKRLRPRDAWDGARAALVASLPELDPGHPGGGTSGNRVWTGPVLSPPATHDLAAHDPAILVSLSTYRFPGMTTALQNLLDATAGLPARVVVTTGPVIDPQDLHLSANHEVHRFVPHDDLMPQMSLVIGHGGHATTMRALAHDLPLVVMPMHPMLDQPMVGRRVEAAGAGRLVRKKASPEVLRPVIEALLQDGPHRIAAAHLGNRIREMDGARTAADRLLEAVGNEVTAH